MQVEIIHSLDGRTARWTTIVDSVHFWRCRSDVHRFCSQGLYKSRQWPRTINHKKIIVKRFCCAQENTVAKLKADIERRLNTPVDQQTLYFQEQVMDNDSVLSSISGLNHGGMVYLSRRRYFSLTIYSWLSGSLEKVQLKLSYSIMVMMWVEGVSGTDFVLAESRLQWRIWHRKFSCIACMNIKSDFKLKIVLCLDIHSDCTCTTINTTC